jgi:hypothetical protein
MPFGTKEFMKLMNLAISIYPDLFLADVYKSYQILTLEI